MKLSGLIVAIVLCPALVWGQGLERQPAPDGAKVYFIAPSDGDTVSSRVSVKFGLRDMGVGPAGIDYENTGHHHLLINVGDDEMPPMDRPLPANDRFVHFGGGQTQAEIELEPGEHTLQLVLGDYLHIPHEPPVISKRITITVE